MAGANPRNGRPYRRLCATVRSLRQPCWRCGYEIDLSLDAQDRWSFTLDHVTPLSRGGDLLDPANARSAHRRCNSSRGNRVDSAPRMPLSRAW